MNARIVAIGNRFEVIVNLNEKMGWVVHTANCHNRDDGVGKLDEVVMRMRMRMRMLMKMSLPVVLS